MAVKQIVWKHGGSNKTAHTMPSLSLCFVASFFSLFLSIQDQYAIGLLGPSGIFEVTPNRLGCCNHLYPWCSDQPYVGVWEPAGLLTVLLSCLRNSSLLLLVQGLYLVCLYIFSCSKEQQFMKRLAGIVGNVVAVQWKLRLSAYALEPMMKPK